MFIHKPSLGPREVPHKIWARFVQPFWRLLDISKKQTDRHPNNQSIYIYIYMKPRTWDISRIFHISVSWRDLSLYMIWNLKLEIYLGQFISLYSEFFLSIEASFSQLVQVYQMNHPPSWEFKVSTYDIEPRAWDKSLMVWISRSWRESSPPHEKNISQRDRQEGSQ